MDKIDKFYEAIKSEMGITLATAADGRVTMRTVSPAYLDGDILIFTSRGSQKYAQLKKNPHCCIEAAGFYAEADAAFQGPTMLDQNEPLRAVYAAKFPGAFDEGVPLGGREAEFIVLKPARLSGWAFENDVPTPDGIPTVPFIIEL